MEQTGQLNIDDMLHMFCLHYVFLPRINHALSVFKDAWNCHPLSTEGNLSPLQLWMPGLAGQQPALKPEVNGYRGSYREHEGCSCTERDDLTYYTPPY